MSNISESLCLFDECWEMPHCVTCGLTKKPRHRSAPLGSSYCDPNCRGYHGEPMAGHHWPDEKCDATCFPA